MTEPPWDELEEWASQHRALETWLVELLVVAWDSEMEFDEITDALNEGFARNGLAPWRRYSEWGVQAMIRELLQRLEDDAEITADLLTADDDVGAGA